MAQLAGREIALRNDERVLKALFKFSYLRTRDLAALIWMPRMKRRGVEFEPVVIEVSASARRMAQRTLQRLRQQRKVISIQAPDGSTIYGLSEAGARQLVNLGIPASSGKDYVRRVSLAYYHHRRIANEVAISAILQGYRATTEHEIATGQWLGGKNGIAGKKPDVVVRDGKNNIWFAEIERSSRNKPGYIALLAALSSLFKDKNADGTGKLPDGHILRQVIFVSNSAFVERVCIDLRDAGWPENLIQQRIGRVKLLYVTQGKFITYFEDRTGLASHARARAGYE